MVERKAKLDAKSALKRQANPPPNLRAARKPRLKKTDRKKELAQEEKEKEEKTSKQPRTSSRARAKSKVTIPSRTNGRRAPSKSGDKARGTANAASEPVVSTSADDVSTGAQTDRDIEREERRYARDKRRVSFAAYDSDGIPLHGSTEDTGDENVGDARVAGRQLMILFL